MNKMKKYPKLALASLMLLIVALAMFWVSWVNLKQTSFVRLLESAIPALNNGGISFAEGRTLIIQLTQLSRKTGSLLGQYAGSDVNSAISLITLLSITYQVLFFGTILSVAYCIYSRLKWKGGLSEAVYFLFFLGDVLIMYLLSNQLNTICGSGTFILSPWGFIALGCSLISEILWEEASFNTPNPLLIFEEENQTKKL